MVDLVKPLKDTGIVHQEQGGPYKSACAVSNACHCNCVQCMCTCCPHSIPSLLLRANVRDLPKSMPHKHQCCLCLLSCKLTWQKQVQHACRGQRAIGAKVQLCMAATGRQVGSQAGCG